MRVRMDIDDSSWTRLNKIMVKNLFEEEGFAGLSWPSNKDGCRMPEGKHDWNERRSVQNDLNNDLYSE